MNFQKFREKIEREGGGEGKGGGGRGKKGHQREGTAGEAGHKGGKGKVSAKYIVVWNGTSACYKLNQSTNFRSKVLKVTN